MSMSNIPLPNGTRLLHIGPHKTGTTALQVALMKHSSDLLLQGVRYISEGPRVNANFSAFALEGRTSRKVEGEQPIPIVHWENLKSNAARAQDRIVVMSGEEFCILNQANILRVVEGFGQEHLRILVTLRPLSRILGSQWQQAIQGGNERLSFDQWLHEVLDYPNNPHPSAQNFWLRHRHDQLIKRWAESVGSEKVSVIVLDESDHSALPRAFERLVGLDAGTIAMEERTVNRSLTIEEAEAVRSFYLRMEDQGYTEVPGHVRYMMSPAEYIKRNRKPLPGEHKIYVPDWATERTRMISEEMVSNIRNMNVQVIGNLENLQFKPRLQSDPIVSYSSLVPFDLVGWTTLGALVHSRVVEGELPLPKHLSPKQIRRATGRQLVRELLRRFRVRFQKGGQDSYQYED